MPDLRLEEIVERSPDGIAVLDLEGRYLYVNAAMAALAHKKREELVGHRYFEVYGDRRDGPVSRALEKAMAGSFALERTDQYVRDLSTWIETTIQRVGDHVIFRSRDTTERNRALADARAVQDRLSFLLEVSTVLSSTLDWRRAIQETAQLAVPRFADACVVDVFGAGGIAGLAVKHVDPSIESAVRAIRKGYPAASTKELAQVLDEGTPRLSVDMPGRLPDAPADANHATLLASAPVRSTMVVPVIARGQRLGVISFWATERNFDRDELALAELIARRAAIAIDNARLFDAEQEARKTAERDRGYLERLQKVTAGFSAAASLSEVARVALEEGLAVLGVRHAGVFVLEEDGKTLVALRTIGLDSAKAPARVPVDGPFAASIAVREGALKVMDWESAVREVPTLPEHVAGAEGGTVLACPLMSGGRALGAFSAAFEKGLPFGPEQRRFVIALAEHASLAMERVRLRERLEADERRQRFLAEASALLSSSLDVEATLARIMFLAVPALADWAVTYLVGPDGRPGKQHVAHVDPKKVELAGELQKRWPPDPDEPQYRKMLATGEATFVRLVPPEMISAAARDPEHHKALADLGIRSGMTVPIRGRERVVGVISLIFAESGRLYGPEDLSLAQELSRRAAVALENASLYVAEQSARRSAEDAAARISRLQDVTSALIGAADPQRVCELAVERGVPAAEAVAGAIMLVSDDGKLLRIISSRGFEGSAVVAQQVLPVDESTPAGLALLSGRPVWIEGPGDWARFRVTPSAGREVGVAIPLTAGRRTPGGLWLAFPAGTRFGEERRQFLLAIGQQCAQALERAELLREARDANRLKDEFLANLSHELRTPLNAMLGWLHMLESRMLDPKGRHKAIGAIHRNARAQARLVEDLLDVSRISSGKFAIESIPLDPSIPVAAAVDSIRPLAEAKKIRVQAILPTDGRAVLGDAPRLGQVVSNLLSNAVKFTPEGGLITVVLSSTAHEVVLQVRDTGEGMDAGFIDHVFERFRQADSSTTRRYGGLGLGLAIVRYIVEQHRGSVSAASAGPGKGSVFTVRLPIYRGRAQVEAPAAEPARLGGTRVLLVDDDHDSREVVATALRRVGGKVTAARSAAAALSAFRKLPHDVLVADIAMPDVDGFELLRRVRALGRGKSLPAVALTALAGADARDRAIAAGFQAYIAKPASIEELVRVVADLDGGRGRKRKRAPARPRARAKRRRKR